MKPIESEFTWCSIRVIAVLVVILFTACDTTSDNETIDENLFPYLGFKNQSTGSTGTVIVSRVGLVGYDFSDLRIGNGESITFSLNNGMPAGFNDVNINVSGSGFSATSIKVDFTEGDTTVLRFINGNLFLE